jgi:hypothetical protein
MRKLTLAVPLLIAIAALLCAPLALPAAHARPSPDVARAVPPAIAPATCGVELLPADSAVIEATYTEQVSRLELATTNSINRRVAVALTIQRLRARGPSLDRREQAAPPIRTLYGMRTPALLTALSA